MPGGAELSEKLPDEIFQLVESFKKFAREQKAYRDQKFDVDPILEVGRDTEDFTLAFQRVAVDSDRNSQLVQQIKDDTTKLLRHSELAYSLLRSQLANNPTLQQQQQQHQPQHQHQLHLNQTSSSSSSQPFGLRHLTSGSNSNNPLQSSTILIPGTNNDSSVLDNNSATPATNLNNQATQSLLHQQQPFYLTGNPYSSANHPNQFANTSSSQYFAELADQFELRMKAYGEQIKELKLSLDSITRNYNVDELFKWLKKQHETLGEIAAKIYMTHERIMEKKTEMDKFNNTVQHKTNLTTSTTFTN